MFIGEFNHTLDEKGRLIVPFKFREELGNEFVVTRGLDGCLFAFNQKDWEKFSEKIVELPNGRDAREFRRYFFGGAVSAEMDKMGRILIPQNLRNEVKLLKDVVFVGVGTRIEIWDKETYEGSTDFTNMDEIAEKMAALGI